MSYRIAFLTDDWNYELVENTLWGLKSYVEEHKDVSLCIFDCFGKDVGNAKDDSEYAIYELPDLRDFDGIIVQSNQLVLKQARERLAQRIQASGIPAISLGCPLAGCTLLRFDNRKAQHDMTEHMIQAHNVRKIVYLTGMLDNDCPEGQQRLDGFLDACRENDIPEGEIEVIPCTWRTSDGAQVAQKWIREKLPLPDAFITANDEMALGILQTLMEKGVRVPQEVRVSGFDNLASGELASPRLTTVNCDMWRMNYFAMECLIEKIEGRDRREEILVDFDLVCSESCGCPSASRPWLIRDKYFEQTRFLRNFYTLQDQMAEKMFEAETPTELMKSIEKNQRIFGCDDVYICMNDFFYDMLYKGEREDEPAFFGEEMVLTACRKLRKSRLNVEEIRFPRHELLPKELIEKEPFLIFYPLHYNRTSIGYLVMDGISGAAKLNLHESILNFLEIAIENVRKKLVLHRLNRVLDDLYVRDALTGLYNRFGLNRQGREVFNRYQREEEGAQIVFTDMDDMKGINDRFGHDIGDEAIRAAANVLRSVCGEDHFIMRYGGDEFIVIASGGEKNLARDIEQASRDYNLTSGQPFTLRLSAGSVYSHRGDNRSLDECVKEADSLMYAAKHRVKP